MKLVRIIAMAKTYVCIDHDGPLDTLLLDVFIIRGVQAVAELEYDNEGGYNEAMPSRELRTVVWEQRNQIAMAQAKEQP